MKIIVGCEESQAVTKELRKLGHEAYSCDILPCSGGHPEWHLQDDILDVIKGEWDMLIAFPPCTRLTVTANRWYKPEYADRFPNIHQERKEAIAFFMALANANINQIAIENPVGIMSSRWRKPNQIIQPWQFGDKAIKKTCLWLKNLPKLNSTEVVEPEYVIYNAKNKKSGKSKYPMMWAGNFGSIERSKTFQGIAYAMATQWT
jgi:site-specific DNA-cytosine methylase